jgi:uncharacterized protein YcfL
MRKLAFIIVIMLLMMSCGAIKNMPQRDKNAYKISFVVGFGLEREYHFIKH